MDLNAISSRLQALNKSSSGTKEKKDYTKIYWKPKEEGKYQIRFLPSRAELPTNPFHEVWIHYGIGKYPIVALTNWGEQDPIIEFAKQLRKQGGAENYQLAKQLDPKMRIFAPVIVRGEEDRGVRLFEFSKTTYMELLGIADDEDYGDFTDVNEGFDFTLTATKAGNRPGFDLTLRPKPKSSPLSTNGDQINEWLTNQPLVLEERYKYPYEDLKNVLKEFITSGTEEASPAKENDFEDEIIDTDSPLVMPTPNYSLSDKPKKVSKLDEFDEMFDDMPWEKQS